MSKIHLYSPNYLLHSRSTLPNFEKKLCSELSQDVFHVRIALLVRYSQWTRTGTELPTVNGL